ncbi:Protein CBG17968 [Caenorhabditis briggsae]|uniref:Protein CBG17968 n=1 Tax=Caenorhabditis briggsae TaxID=6238 RepID=A8XSP7_CAEBR|nr:Protein CBG17968 [Caenorhabditis briggsae]CAP35499.2 Protein CBG17968 [Caenorhabditis briggsae]
MRFLVIFGVLFVTVNSIVFDDDSSSGSHESSYYSGGRGGHHGGRPPKHQPVTERPETKCEPGWTRVHRQSGGWCVKVFVGMTNQPQAELLCAQHGARLSAVENHEERETIAELGRVMMTTTSAWKFGTLRTGIKRDTLHSPFYITDGNAKGLNAVKWSGGEPNQGSYGLEEN